jgi:hypothetical protein
MTNFRKSGKTRLSGFIFWNIRFQLFQNRNRTGAKLEDLKIQGCFEVWKMIKKYQGANIEGIQAKIRGHKNRTVWFGISEYLVFPKQIESD